MQRGAELLIKMVHKDIYGRIQKIIVGIATLTEVIGSIEMTKEQTISILKDGGTIKTIYTDDNGIYQLGSSVYFYMEIDGTEYLKTYSNNTGKDNLDNLPTF